MKSPWRFSIVGSVVILSCLGVTSAIFSCAQNRNEASGQPKCFCDEKPEYYTLICPLENNETVSIIVKQDDTFEIDCKGNVINNISFIPTLTHQRSSRHLLDYFGIVDCPMNDFDKIANKLINNTRINRVALKKISTLEPRVFQNFDINFLYILNSRLTVFPEHLLYDLKNLQYISLQTNANLTTLPENFFQQSPNLLMIDLGQNHLTHLPKTLFYNLHKLSHLLLFSNNISSLDEDQFKDLINLTVLELMTNRLTTLPANIFNHLVNLSSVSLRKNLFTHLPEHLFRYNRKLKQIQFNDNPNLTYIPENFFANLTNLTEVALNLCNLSSIHENVFWGVSNLRKLNLAYNRLKRLERFLFRDTINLENLQLDHNQLESIEEKTFEFLTNLKTLTLTYNQIQIQDNTFFGLKHLESMSLSHNSLYNFTSRSLKHLKNIKFLDLSHNNLSLAPPLLPELTDFSILPALETLQVLQLDNNAIEIIYSDWLFTLPSLQRLHLANNKIKYLRYTDLQFTQHHTVHLHLEDNLISTIDLSGIELLMKMNENVNNFKQRFIYLKGNQLECNCHIYDFVRYIDGTMDPIVKNSFKIQYDDLKCASPDKYSGEYVKYLNSKNLTCALDTGPKTKCQMQYYEYRNYNSRLIVNCSNNNLTEIPRFDFNRSHIPFKVEGIEVILSGNRITKMPKNVAAFDDVVELDLSHNFIDEITWVPPRIEVLRLDHNNLTYLNNRELLLINHTSVRNITFHNNPWKCNCELTNFTKYLQENFKKIPHLHNVTCAEEGSQIQKELTRLSPADLCPYEKYVLIITCSLLTMLGIVTSIFIAIYYRYKHEIKVWLYAHNMCLSLITEDEIDQDKLYDAFLSFSHEDEDFVVNELLPKLEDGPNPFKLCVHFRDFQPGEFITTNITRSIDSSKRTVVVLSKGFLRSEWGKMEFRTAHTEAMREGRARVIVILYGDIGPVDDLDPELRAYLNTNTYVKWGSPWFWDNLRYALPHSSRPNLLKPEVLTVSEVVKNPRQTTEKSDLFHEPPTPPAASTPPAEVHHRLNDPLYISPPTALNVSLINGNLVNNMQHKVFETKNNNLIYNQMELKV